MCLIIMKMVHLSERKENFLALIGLVIIPQFGFHIKAQKARLLKFWARMFLISLVHTKEACIHKPDFWSREALMFIISHTLSKVVKA